MARSGPCDKAVEAMVALLDERTGRVTNEDLLREGLGALHDPTLGLDRSVCLRDVVEALRHGSPGSLQWGEQAATFIEREFGDTSCSR